MVNIKIILFTTQVYVEEPSMPEKVKVFGPGIEKTVTCSEGTHFFVDCSEAGPGDVAISLTDDKGMDVPVDADDNGEGLFRWAEALYHRNQATRIC